jgi:hypothetical protein
MQKAIRNTSGKPVSVESLDKRDAARQSDSHRPVTKVAPVATDSSAKARAAGDKLDREHEANRQAQARAERHQGSDNAANETEFDVLDRH